MVDWLAGKRIKGTSTERTNSFIPSVGGWVEVGRTTLGSLADDITVSSLPDKRYYMILRSVTGTGSTQASGQLGYNSIDTGTNYTTRYNDNGGSDGALTSTRFHGYDGYDDKPELTVQYIANYATKEKLVINHTVNQATAGAGYAPRRRESVWKWTNTSNALNIYNCWDGGSGQHKSGSEVVVLGWDPTDTHTSNFWEELASVELGSANNAIDSGVFTAKKYIWIQVAITGSSGSEDNHNIQVGNTTIDNGYNYSTRYNIDGGIGTDGEQLNQTVLKPSFNIGYSNERSFFNCFIINNSANEKLFMGHTIRFATAGAGVAPSRCEFVGKWDNTTNQFDRISYKHQNGATTFNTGSIMKVWGSD